MFYGKRIKALEEKVANLEQFEKSVCTIIDNYFETNKKQNLKFSTDCVADKFYHFVNSVDEKFKKLEKIEEENADLRHEISEKEKRIVVLKEIVELKNDTIKRKDEEINELASERSALEIELIGKKREMARTKNTTKGGKKNGI